MATLRLFTCSRQRNVPARGQVPCCAVGEYPRDLCLTQNESLSQKTALWKNTYTLKQKMQT